MTQNQDGNNSQNQQDQQMEDTGSGRGQPGTFTGGSGGQAGNSGAGRSDMGQPGSGAGASGQQRQYDQGGGQMGGSGGSSGDDSRFAEQIREHMQVIDADGNDVGMVDSCEGGQIKLTREGSPDGEHRYLQMNEVEAVEGDTVRLRSTGNSESNAGFGQGV